MPSAIVNPGGVVTPIETLVFFVHCNDDPAAKTRDDLGAYDLDAAAGVTASFPGKYGAAWDFNGTTGIVTLGSRTRIWKYDDDTYIDAYVTPGTNGLLFVIEGQRCLQITAAGVVTAPGGFVAEEFGPDAVATPDDSPNGEIEYDPFAKRIRFAVKNAAATAFIAAADLYLADKTLRAYAFVEDAAYPVTAAQTAYYEWNAAAAALYISHDRAVRIMAMVREVVGGDTNARVRAAQFVEADL